MAPAIECILNALGIYRNFPRSLVFAPIQYLGLGITHLHTIQEISRLTDLITHTADMTITGSLYRASLEVFLIEMGISTDLDSIPFDKTHFLSSDALIKSSWEFLCSYKITLNHDIQWKIPRKNDAVIMQVFLAANLSP